MAIITKPLHNHCIPFHWLYPAKLLIMKPLTLFCPGKRAFIFCVRRIFCIQNNPVETTLQILQEHTTKDPTQTLDDSVCIVILTFSFIPVSLWNMFDTQLVDPSYIAVKSCSQILLIDVSFLHSISLAWVLFLFFFFIP